MLNDGDLVMRAEVARRVLAWCSAAAFVGFLVLVWFGNNGAPRALVAPLLLLAPFVWWTWAQAQRSLFIVRGSTVTIRNVRTVEIGRDDVVASRVVSVSSFNDVFELEVSDGGRHRVNAIQRNLLYLTIPKRAFLERANRAADALGLSLETARD